MPIGENTESAPKMAKLQDSRPDDYVYKWDDLKIQILSNPKRATYSIGDKIVCSKVDVVCVFSIKAHGIGIDLSIPFSLSLSFRFLRVFLRPIVE